MSKAFLLLAALFMSAAAPAPVRGQQEPAWSPPDSARGAAWRMSRPPRPAPRHALWIEVSANLERLSTRESIRALVAQARAAGIDTLVPEAKNAWGFVIYESAVAPHIRTSPVARAGYAPPREWFPRGFDPFAVLIEEAHAAGLRVHAAVNVFGEGLILEGQPPAGPILERKEWQTVHLGTGTSGGEPVVPAETAGSIIFANPAHPEVQLYELAVVWEIVARYPVDGIVLDRARFDNVTADFSDLSRRQFESYLGRAVERWPDDVLTDVRGRPVRGPLFPRWLTWRARTIRDFVRAADRLVHQIRPDLPVGMYVGAWYAQTLEVGQNWAAPVASAPFADRTAEWAEASLLPHLDYLMVGLYFRSIADGGAGTRTVAGAAVRARELVGQTPLIGGVWLALYEGRRDAGEGALRVTARLMDGVMIFDLSDVQQGDWWAVLTAR